MTRSQPASPRRAALLAAALLVVPTGPAEAKKTTCKSGKSVYNSGGVRVFYVKKSYYDRPNREKVPYYAFYGCSPSLTSPKKVYEASPWTDPAMKRFRLSGDGNRLGYVIEAEAETSSSTKVGWLDLRSGASKQAELPDEEGFGVAVKGLAIADDGGIAWVGAAIDGRSGQDVGYVPFGTKSFGKPRVVANLLTGDVVPSSLAVANGTITWQTRSGQTGSAPTTGSVASGGR